MRSTREHLVVLSDVHLSQAHPEDPTDPLWMKYRTRAFHPDRDFARLVELLLPLFGEEDRLELCFNGDILDFDAPWVKDGDSSFDEFVPDDQGASAQAQRIIDDHPLWFEAVGRVLSAGHRVTFISGNHDTELYFSGVREVIRKSLEQNSSVPVDERNLTFRTWFHLTEGGVYVEHGSQYDLFNNLLHAMLPVTPTRDRLHPVCGKLAFKRTGSRIGYLNPYYEETFLRSAYDHLSHFARDYALSRRRDIVRPWLLGAIKTCVEIAGQRRVGPDCKAWIEEGNERAVRETGASSDSVRETYALTEPSAEVKMMPMVRELWMDRTLLTGVFSSASVGVAAHWGFKAGLMTLAGGLSAFTLYELLMPKPVLQTYDAAPPRVDRLFDIHRVDAVCMGHTHRPFEIWNGRRVRANSGSWCPAFMDMECTKPVLDARPFLWLTTDAGVKGGLHWLRDGELRRNDA